MSPREKRSARDVALDALMQVDKANAWSDEALRRLIAQNGLDSRDAAFATRLCYGVMQNRMLLDYYIGCWCAQKPERLEPVIRSILRIGGYQILFMDRVPHRAAVNEAVEMTRRHGRPKAAGMVNAVLRRFVEHWMDMPDLPKGSTADYLSLRYSHPKWLVLRLLDLIGPDETQEFLRLDNDAVPTCIQVNPLKTTAEDLERELRGDGVTVQPHPWLEGCLEITGTGDLRSLPAFREGRFLVQDAAARLAAMAASAAPGDRVLDVCAAPGGEILLHGHGHGRPGADSVLRRPPLQGEAHRKRRTAPGTDLHPRGCCRRPGEARRLGGAGRCGHGRRALFGAGDHPEKAGYPL